MKPVFMSVAEFKTLFSLETINVYVNKETGAKSFCINPDAEDKMYCRVQESFDYTKPSAILCSEFNEFGIADWSKGVLVNVKEQSPTHNHLCSL